MPTLVDQSLRSAELQLLDAREALKEARRRVVQLEDALEGWQRLREQMARARRERATRRLQLTRAGRSTQFVGTPRSG